MLDWLARCNEPRVEPGEACSSAKLVQLCESGSRDRSAECHSSPASSNFVHQRNWIRAIPPPRQSKLHHESPRSSDQFFRVRMRKLKSKFRVSPRPFVPSKFNNIPRSLEFPFFRVSRGICPGIARFKPGQRRSKNHATDDDPYAPYKILNLPSCFRYLPETDYPWKSE